MFLAFFLCWALVAVLALPAVVPAVMAIFFGVTDAGWVSSRSDSSGASSSSRAAYHGRRALRRERAEAARAAADLHGRLRPDAARRHRASSPFCLSDKSEQPAQTRDDEDTRYEDGGDKPRRQPNTQSPSVRGDLA